MSKPTPDDFGKVTYDSEHSFNRTDWGYALDEALRDVRLTEGFSGDLAFTSDDIAEVVDAAEGENDGPNWLAVLRLRDGRYVYMVAGCDYTGWDCQSGGSCWLADSVDNLLRYAMDDDGRARLVVAKPAEPAA